MVAGTGKAPKAEGSSADSPRGGWTEPADRPSVREAAVRREACERSAREFRRTGPRGRKHFNAGRCLLLCRQRPTKGRAPIARKRNASVGCRTEPKKRALRLFDGRHNELHGRRHLE